MGTQSTKPRGPCACGRVTTATSAAGTFECSRCAGIFETKAPSVVWADVLAHAAGIVRSYNTGVTLRQLFYRLVSDLTLPNTPNYYRALSSHTAEGRREGTFPELLDRTSKIERYQSFADLAAARKWLRAIYRRDRTEGQECTVILAVEKAGLSAQLAAWFTGPYGIPHVALGGYASQTLCDQVRRDVERQGRPAILIYAGDHDPTGEDIDRDFEARTACWEDVIRVALSRLQVQRYNLPTSVDADVAAKLKGDPRAAAFMSRHGDLVQYEVDALPPDVLQELFWDALGDYWDDDAHDAVMAQEKTERDELGAAA